MSSESNTTPAAPKPLAGETLRAYLGKFGINAIVAKLAEEKKLMPEDGMGVMREAIAFCESPILTSEPSVYDGRSMTSISYMRSICQLALAYYDYQQEGQPDTGLSAMFKGPFTAYYWQRRAISNFIKTIDEMSPPARFSPQGQDSKRKGYGTY